MNPVDEMVKRYLLPPLVALPLVVGFLFIVIGGAEGGGETMIYIGLVIVLGNAAFWPLFFTWEGKRKKQQQMEEARRRAQEMAKQNAEEE